MEVVSGSNGQGRRTVGGQSNFGQWECTKAEILRRSYTCPYFDVNGSVDNSHTQELLDLPEPEELDHAQLQRNLGGDRAWSQFVAFPVTCGLSSAIANDAGNDGS